MKERSEPRSSSRSSSATGPESSRCRRQKESAIGPMSDCVSMITAGGAPAPAPCQLLERCELECVDDPRAVPVAAHTWALCYGDQQHLEHEAAAPIPPLEREGAVGASAEQDVTLAHAQAAVVPVAKDEIVQVRALAQRGQQLVTQPFVLYEPAGPLSCQCGRPVNVVEARLFGLIYGRVAV
eukprot:scaffold64466_cov24-Tisochrysis_lutea.AAC.1